MAGERNGAGVAIAVAIIGLVGTLLGAFIGILPSLGIFEGGGGHGYIPTLPRILDDAGVSPPGNGDGGSGGGVIPAGPAAANPEIYLSATSVPAGESINVSGEGFRGGETVVIRVHTDEVASTEANSTGGFSSVAITIPAELSAFAPNRFTVTATGRDSVRSARKQVMVSG